MVSSGDESHYKVLGVHPLSTLDELRSAYRSRARECHPDIVSVSPNSVDMARLNEAWRVLSDEEKRYSYDLSIRMPIPDPQPAPQTARSRRESWVSGIRAQIIRLARLAGRSATQTMLTRAPLAPRESYDEVVERLVQALADDTEARVRSARAAGVTPLDLGVAAVLVGIRSESDRIRRKSSLGVDLEMQMSAELLDRMWDVLAHELPNNLPTALGGNPNLTRLLIG